MNFEYKIKIQSEHFYEQKFWLFFEAFYANFFFRSFKIPKDDFIVLNKLFNIDFKFYFGHSECEL